MSDHGGQHRTHPVGSPRLGGAYTDRGASTAESPPAPPPPPPYPGHRQAKAAAKAEKARAKALRPWYRKKRWWVVGGLVIVAAMIAASSIGDDTGNDRGTGSGGERAAAGSESGQEVYAIGQTAHTGDFDVTVHGVTDPYTPTNELDLQAAEGLRYVAIELTMANTSSEPQPLSTLAGAELTDHLDRLATYSLAGVELQRIDSATVAPGEARRGWVVFEVPADAQELKLRIRGNLTATGSLFQIT